MDLSFAKNRISESERADAHEMLNKGHPLFLEIDEIVSQDTIKGSLVLGAFGAPRDTKVHVRQLRTHSHIDSLTRHIQGSAYMPALRKGDIVAFDRVFIANGDAMTAQITARTHDGMKGRVQFVKCMARASTTSVNKKRGAMQQLTIVDGNQAFRVENDEDVRLVHKRVCEMDWTAGAGGFVVRTPNGRAYEYHVTKDNPLQAFLDDIGARRHFDNGGWLELIPARRFPVGREQVSRDVDIRTETTKAIGNVGRWYMGDRFRFPGFKPSAVILCDEDEWAFGGKTGKIHRVAAGIQPLNRAKPVEPADIPSRIEPQLGTVMPISGLYSEATMDRMAEDRASRRPPEPQSSKSRGIDMPDYDDHRDEGKSHTSNAMPFSFGPGGKFMG